MLQGKVAVLVRVGVLSATSLEKQVCAALRVAAAVGQNRSQAESVCCRLHVLQSTVGPLLLLRWRCSGSQVARYRPLVAGWNQCRISSCLVVNNCSIIPGRFFCNRNAHASQKDTGAHGIGWQSYGGLEFFSTAIRLLYLPQIWPWWRARKGPVNKKKRKANTRGNGGLPPGIQDLLAEPWDSFHFPGDSQLAGRKSVGVVGSGVEQ